MKNKKVLEVGLGYGTLGLQIAQAGAYYHGLDIAGGPVKMMQDRLNMFVLDGTIVQGSMLECPFEERSMDCVVSIGCFHHTGNLQACLDETHRVLKPGGTAYIMVYNQRSYRQWRHWPSKTFKALLRDWGLHRKEIEVSEEQRGAYDRNLSGSAAPETIFSSIAQLKKMLSKYSKVAFYKEHCEDIHVIPRVVRVPRRFLLSSLGRMLGTDIYFEAQK